jgi:ribosomal protein S18 acetylase RimI-like enzyme
MPTWDGQVHANLFAQQQAGLWTYLVAWKEGSAPVGVCVIRWDGSAEEEPEPCAEWPRLTNLRVHPAHRGRGVGTALIEAAEERARGRGFSLLGISVADDNPEAARLYARLGFADSGLRRESRYMYPDDSGALVERVEHDILLVKALDVGCH